MIKSNCNTLASWFILLSCFFFLFVAITTLSCHYFHFCPFYSNMLYDDHFVGQLCSSSLGFISFIILASLKIKMLTIDSAQKKLLIRNLVTRNFQLYSFSELDRISDMLVNHGRTGSKSYKTIGIFKNKRLILKIDSYYYSNIDEMRTALLELPYLGIDIDWANQKFN